jgi:hypothetical protein
LSKALAPVFVVAQDQVPTVMAALLELHAAVGMCAEEEALPSVIVDAWCLADAVLGEHLELPVLVLDP